ncbi:MAG: zinc ABC transporter substrate-binding protein [Rhizobacter sp.]
MRIRSSWMAGAAALCAVALPAPSLAFTVFACEPEWAALVRTFAPEAKVLVATHPGQDPHHIEARPALIAQLRSADLVVCTGAALEAGWLPTLQQRAGNARAQEVFFAAAQVALIDARPGAVATPWSGDVHAQGNPHLHTDPHRLRRIAKALAERLQADWPERRADIAQRHASFDVRWAARIADWERQAAPLRGQRVAAQHTSFGYLWAWLGMRQVADLEPKPGMPPTPGHLQSLLDPLRGEPPKAVVVAGYQDVRAGRWLTGQLGSAVPLVVLPATVAVDADGAALMEWMDGVIHELLRAAAP